jgi:hypothetical protein
LIFADEEMLSPRFSIVYRNGLCNLAATGSKDGNGGLYLDKPASRQALVRPFYVRSSWPGAPNNFWHVFPKYAFDNILLEGPLLQRAWVIQERILAPRVLHFTSSQLYWECHGYDACETYPSGPPPEKLKRQELFRFKQIYKPLDALTNVEEMLDFWRTIVMTYSGCELTKNEDKLVALSGIAKVLTKKFPHAQYLAGLWREDLKFNLLWYIDITELKERRTLRDPQVYRAPSWSWASVDYKCKFYTYDRKYFDENPESDIVEAEIEPMGLDPTGQVKSGFIRLQGPLLTGSILENGPRNDTEAQIKLKVNGIWRNVNKHDRDFCSDRDESIKKVHCMPILCERIDDDFERFYCLLLVPTGLKSGEFRRVGLFALNPQKWHIHSWKRIQNEKWLEYETCDGVSKYTVKVV